MWDLIGREKPFSNKAESRSFCVGHVFVSELTPMIQKRMSAPCYPQHWWFIESYRTVWLPRPPSFLLAILFLPSAHSLPCPCREVRPSRRSSSCSSLTLTITPDAAVLCFLQWEPQSVLSRVNCRRQTCAINQTVRGDSGERRWPQESKPKIQGNWITLKPSGFLTSGSLGLWPFKPSSQNVIILNKYLIRELVFGIYDSGLYEEDIPFGTVTDSPLSESLLKCFLC